MYLKPKNYNFFFIIKCIFFLFDAKEKYRFNSSLFAHIIYQPEYSITATLPKFNCARKFAFLSNSIPLLLG